MNNFFSLVVKLKKLKIMTKKKKIKDVNNDYIKANNHGEWLAINEFSTGYISIHKTHKSEKTYSRKKKHK